MNGGDHYESEIDLFLRKRKKAPFPEPLFHFSAVGLLNAGLGGGALLGVGAVATGAEAGMNTGSS